MRINKAYLMAGAAILALGSTAAHAQAEATEAPAGDSAEAAGSDEQLSAGEEIPGKEIVVTGSRLRQTTDTGTTAPVSIISSEAIAARGFTDAGSALAEMPSMRPPAQPNSGTGDNPGLSGQAGIGAEYPNLFNLGAGRTLTLVNGRRTISTSGGLGDEAVDANIIPIGLLRKIDVVQGGGAVVYGSGAIAGVVNYVLRDDFKGVEIDGQLSQTSRWDYPTGSFRVTAGTDALDGRANIALNLEYSKTGHILRYDRRITTLNPFVTQNLVPGAGSNGIPAQTYIQDINIPNLSHVGTIVTSPSAFGVASLLQVGGESVRFNPAGTLLVPFDEGTTVPSLGIATVGGDYEKNSNGRDGAAVPGVERYVANLLAHIDLTDDIRLSGELTYAKVIGRLPNERHFLTQYVNFLGSFPGLRNITFTRDNAYLTPEVIAQLDSASPSFAAGGPLVLGKGNWASLYPDNNGSVTNTTNTYRGVLALDGKLNWGERELFWSASYSHGESHLKIDALYPHNARLRKALDAVRSPTGQIVCRVNVDADPTNDDPACVPLNAFGTENVTDEARNYVLVRSGTGNGGTATPSVNKQDDFLLTFGGGLFKLPMGEVQFSTSYEHRAESSSFNPLEADRLGLVLSLIPVVPASGKFNTDEVSAEINIPLLGEDVTLPFAQAVDLNASYRYVDHSLAGSESVWGAGLRWKVVDGVRLRASYSRNFRAPNLAQLLLPSSATNGAIVNPCGPDQIGLGLSASTRAANCLALFQANPTFGTGTSATGTNQVTPAGASAEVRLANFIRNINATATVTTAGNPDLGNENSTTKTFGFVLEPAFAPGLVISADRIDLSLKDAIVPFTASQFAAACFDSSPQPDDLCGGFTFDSSGQIVTGTATSVNAGSYKLKADTFTINYTFPLETIFGGGDKGTLALALQGTHNRFQTETVGTAVTRSDDTPALPDWVGRFDARYSIGKFKLNYTLNYLSKVKINSTATRENSPDFMPFIAANTRHNISFEYDFGVLKARAGVNNLTDKMPSFPTNYYGDLVGRSFFVGVNAAF
ncbi:TonB-dependent receptor domain-containing protein [Sphingopyxis granuli]|uniref:TonB-dependent receptor domain-containing protein n=1 Tax=Sphingopyxis granuli TaxID=267128 RepID=UPI00301C1376